VWRLYGRWRRSRDERVQRIAYLTKAVDDILPIITDIQRELKTNSGSTLRDVVLEIRNEHAIERQARRVMSNLASFEYKLEKDDTHVLHVSPQFVRLTGLTREDAEDDGWLRAVSEDDRDRVAHGFRRAMRESKVFVTTYTVVNIHTEANTRVEHTGTPVFNHAGDIVGWVGVLRERPAAVLLMDRDHEEVP
jgi:PAS domain S-box-containing protein